MPKMPNSKKRKADAMKDSYLSDIPEGDMPFDLSTLEGMRHSIRPRRAHLDQADVRLDAPQLDERDVFNALEAPAIRSRSTRIDDPLSHAERIARWEDLDIEEPGANRARNTAMPVADADRDTATARAFDLLRTRLRQTTKEHGWRNIAVTAPTRGCGNTFTAVNLALALSRVEGSRTILMDLNLRHPGLADAFDMHPRHNMRDFLSGGLALEDHLVRLSDTLALGLNDTADNSPAEVLQGAATAHTLNRMTAALTPDLVIYDMPPMLAHDDVSAFLPQLDGVLLVSDGTQTMARQLVECERLLEGQVPLLGVVLNRARRSSIPDYS